MGVAKKLGRTLARPKFGEETPRRRTARPQPVIVTALHNLRHFVRMSRCFLKRVGEVLTIRGEIRRLGHTDERCDVRHTTTEMLCRSACDSIARWRQRSVRGRAWGTSCGDAGPIADETWLVGDVGATNARFGLVSPEREVLHTRTHAVADHPTIADAIAISASAGPCRCRGKGRSRSPQRSMATAWR
jgi:hypothetical protein